MKQPVRLLIAEDEDPIRQSIEKYIRKNSKYVDEIYTAANGQEAFDLILRYRPQIILLDIQMPMKDGLSIMRETKAAGIHSRIIILSGHDQFSYAQQALRYGAVDYLLKPCRAAEILAQVEALVKKEMAAERIPPEVGLGEEKHGNRMVAQALEYMEIHYPELLTLTTVAEEIGISPNYLSALFRKMPDGGFVDTLNKIRINRACDYFAAGGLRTYEVAYKVGFRDEKYFSSVFKKLKGESPSEYKKHTAE